MKQDDIKQKESADIEAATDGVNPEDLKHEIEEWKGKYLRALADYQNLEKRRSQERMDEIQYATRQFILKVLPVLDTFERALAHTKDQGVALAVKQFLDVLRTEQVVRIDVLGKPFDPHTMECIEVVAGEKDDIVVEEVRPGYTMHDKVIQPAQVKVSKKK